MPKALGTCPSALNFCHTSPPILYLPITPSLPCPPLLPAGSPSKAQITWDLSPHLKVPAWYTSAQALTASQEVSHTAALADPWGHLATA